MTRWLKACTLVALGLPLAPSAAPTTTPGEPLHASVWCVERLCVGDTLAAARRFGPAGAERRERDQGVEWRGPDGRLWLRAQLSADGDVGNPASRIQSLVLMQPGAVLPVGEPPLTVGGSALGLERLSTPGRWFDPEPAHPGVRLWVTEAALGAPGASPTSWSVGVDRNQRVAWLSLQAHVSLSTGFRDAASALAWLRNRMLAREPQRAAVPLPPPGTPLPHRPLWAQVLVLPASTLMGVSSQPGCDTASCQWLTLEIGGDALGLGDGEPLDEPGLPGARYQPTQCGGSCTPARVAFMHHGQPVRLDVDVSFGQAQPLSPAQERIEMLRWARAAIAP